MYINIYIYIYAYIYVYLYTHTWIDRYIDKYVYTFMLGRGREEEAGKRTIEPGDREEGEGKEAIERGEEGQTARSAEETEEMTLRACKQLRDVSLWRHPVKTTIPSVSSQWYKKV